jgi:hypothetical protein
VNGFFVNDLLGANVLGLVLGFEFFFGGKGRGNGGRPDWLPNRLNGRGGRTAPVFGQGFARENQRSFGRLGCGCFFGSFR